MADASKRRPRRQFTEEFKGSAVRLVLDEGKTVGAAARDLDLTETALREWVRRAQADRTKGRTGLTLAERGELARLRREVRELRTVREILEKPRPSSRSTRREVRLDRRGEGLLPSAPPLPRARGVAQRLLRLAGRARVGPGARPVVAVRRRLGGQCDQRPAPDVKALTMVVERRCPEAELLHHSDQGSPYTSETTRSCCSPTASCAA
jgi:transposase